MRIYQLTDIGNAEASVPASDVTPSMKVLYYLRKRSNRTASDDMIAQSLFNGDISQAHDAIRKALSAKAIKAVG